MSKKLSYAIYLSLVAIVLVVSWLSWIVYEECVECTKTFWIEYSLGIILALVLTITITIRQDFQAHRTHKIAEDTKEIAEQITGERTKQRNITRFFASGAGEKIYVHAPTTKFDRNTRKPLPILNTGDSFGYSILAELIGSERLVPQFHEARDLENNNNSCPPSIEGGSSTHICLCSPRSNLLLNSLVPVLDEETPDSPPAWFQWKPKDSLGSENKYVQIVNCMGTMFQSPADYIYQKAADLTQDFGSSGETLYDYGIVARLTHQSLDQLSIGKTLIVIAGIHQYGTWIASEFVKRNILRETGLSKNFCFSLQDANTPDFTCVVLGEFLPLQRSGAQPGFCVGNIDVVDLWNHEQGGWVSRLDLKHKA